MSLAELRTLLVGASLGEGPLAQFARLALETWGSETGTGRQGPLSNAEKCRRRRLRKKGIDPDGDTGATPNDTGATPETTPSDTAAGSAPSRALPLSPSPVSSLSSSPSPSHSQSEDLGVSGGSTGAGARANGAPLADAKAPVESGTFRLQTPSATPSDTRRDTKRHRGDTDTKARRIAPDWQPSAETRAWCESKGVDVAQAVPEFVGYWDDEADTRNRKALKTPRGWDRTFRNRIDWLLANERAPMLPPPPAPSPLRGDAAQARSVADVLNGNSLPAILAAKETKAHG